MKHNADKCTGCRNCQLICSLAHPLSPANPVILGAGPLVGTAVPGASRVMANARLPLTGAVASAGGSMGLGAHLKWSGLDHLVLLGRAPEPTLIYIDKGRVEFQPARSLWGMGILETTRSLWDTCPGASVLAIGPAGENGAYLSLAMIDACATLGRGGLAAVLGSKNLKALVVKGGGGVKVADPARLRNLVKGLYERLENFEMREATSQLGMIGAWPMYASQLLPYGSSEEDLREMTERFGPQAYLKLKKCRISCPSCFLADKDELYLPRQGRSVYSTSFLNVAILGCVLGMEDAEEAASTLALLDDLGLDFMTLSCMAAFLLELHERGIIGEESRACTMLVRNQDCLYDPRVSGLGTMEFEQITSPRGPTSASAGSATYVPGLPEDRLRRLTARMGAGEEALDRIFSPPWGMNVGRLTRYSEDWFSLFSSLGICNRYQINRFYHAELIRDLLAAVTGVELEVSEMMGKAASAWELYREVNMREDLGREEDQVPEAWFREQPLWGRGGRLKDYMGNELSREDVLTLLEDYYDERDRK